MIIRNTLVLFAMLASLAFWARDDDHYALFFLVCAVGLMWK